MKTKSNTVRYLLATAALGVFASFTYAGPPTEGWRGTKQVKTFTEAKAVEPDAIVTMACDKCKTVLVRDSRHIGPLSKGREDWFVVGSNLYVCAQVEQPVEFLRSMSGGAAWIEPALCAGGAGI